MALAVIEADSSDATGRRFRIDVGKNRFYKFLIGEEKARNRFGISEIDSPTVQSDVMGPLPDSTMGRHIIELPATIDDPDAELLQLVSYRTADQKGPAYSSIVRITRPRPLPRELPEPVVPWRQESTMQSVETHDETKTNPWFESSLSQAQFLGALTGMLPSILPVVGNLVGGLFGNRSGGGGGGGGGNAPNPLAALGNPEMIQQIVNLLSQLGAGGANATNPAPATAAPQAQALAKALQEHPGSPIDRNVISDAMIAPALLAALPALMPILQQVLTPETVQSIIQAPQQGVTTVINGIKDVAKLGLQSHEQDLRHLRQLNPGVRDVDLERLMLQMSVGLRQMEREPRYKRVASVRLAFRDVVSHTVAGATTVAYKRQSTLKFPLNLETPRPLRRCWLELALKEADTLKIVYRKREPLSDVGSGPINFVHSVPGTSIAKTPKTKDYIVCATLLWKNRNGEKRGTSMQQKMTLIQDHLFDGIDEASKLYPLNNTDRFRQFWHKVWEGPFTREARRIDVNLKYTYGLSLDAEQNTRIQTTSATAIKNRRRTGQLESGMELSLGSLNELLTAIESPYHPLDKGLLAALETPAFVERVNQQASYRVQLRGDRDDTGAVWVYPEVKIPQIRMKGPKSVNDNGNVTEFETVGVHFPIPALIHVIGVVPQ